MKLLIMEPLEIIQKKIGKLPTEAYLPLMEYLEYLSFKFQLSEEDEEYDKLLHQLLRDRYEEYKKNPENTSVSMDEMDHQLVKKYRW